MCVFLPLFLKDIFTGYRILDWWFLPLVLERQCSSFFPFELVSDQKSTFIRILVLLHITCLSLVAFKIFSFVTGFVSLFMICCNVFFLHVSVPKFINLHGSVGFIKFGKFSVIFLQIFFLSSPLWSGRGGGWSCNDIYTWLLEIVPQLTDAGFLLLIFFCVSFLIVGMFSGLQIFSSTLPNLLSLCVVIFHLIHCSFHLKKFDMGLCYIISPIQVLPNFHPEFPLNFIVYRVQFL